MTRLSTYFLPTEKQAPADAEALSHKLMVRAGLIRQLGAGLWSFLPAGWRVHERVVQIIREEMNAVGGQELLMPVMLPADLWQRSGRYGIPELFKLQDRRGAGLLRTREFIMKDAYTFDRDKEGLDAHYERYREAYDSVMERCGIEWYRVEADVGAMGGHGAHEYMAPSPAGENDVALAPGYAANVEVASAVARPVQLPPGLNAPELVETPGLVTVADVAGRMEVDPGALLKAYPVMVEDRGLLLVMVRGDHRVNEIKLQNAIGAPFRAARENEFAQRVGPAGYIGPVGIDVPIVL